MNSAPIGYPTAVASDDSEGIAQAIAWCLDRLGEGEKLSVWTSDKRSLRNFEPLDDLVARYSDVEHVTARTFHRVRPAGPVLMVWPDMDDIGKLLRFGSSRIRGLCVVAFTADEVHPWVAQAHPDILGDGTCWEGLAPQLDPVVIQALKFLTRVVNFNNSIAGGAEKDRVVGALVELHRAGIPMEAWAMQGWALAHGWADDAPARLGEYVEAIQAGKNFQYNKVFNPGFVDLLRKKAAEADSDAQP